MLLTLTLLLAPANPPKPDYDKDVLPILKQHCLKCHGADEKIKGGLNLTSRKAVLAGGDTGPAFDEKKPADSLLLKAIRYKDEAYQMPPKGKLPDAELTILEAWIADGLTMPEGKEIEGHKPKGGVVTEEAKKYWAYQPVRKPAVPEGSASNPIDRFLDATLAGKTLAANGAADRLTLARRLAYDLHGLPMSPAEVDAFVADKTGDAWEKLIDRLLDSPRYGEKWGRHWLDVVRYAETNGYERDGIKPNAWRYRDYVIKSFNDNKPFDRFVREQIAGDELFPGQAEAIVATGFYRLGTWDDEPADPLLARFDGYDDLVATIGQGFLAMTFNCARCHDHKVDPIPAADYYRMVAFVRDVRPFSETRNVVSKFSQTDVTPVERRRIYEAELKERQAQIEKLVARMTELEDAAIKRMPAEDQRAAEGLDRPQVVVKVPGKLTEEEKQTYNWLKSQKNQLERKPVPNQDMALSVNHCDVTPPKTHVLIRGNPATPGKDEIKPGFPAVLGLPEPTATPTKTSSGRRTVLANWLVDPANPMTARVFVNRVWQHHFGRGLVGSPNDFGKLGEKPTHPELLDWLAATFVESGWDVKALHKRILTTAAYRRSSKANATAIAADPQNLMLWRFPMRRLGAEEVRDSMLLVSGQLDLAMGGPSVYPKIPPEVLAGQSVPGQGWAYDPKNPARGNRRTVYVHVKRSLQVPVLANHDQADTDSSCPVRYTTTVPTQALGMMNGEFSNEQAAAFATRLAKDAGDDREAKAKLAIRMTTGRPATADDVVRDLAFIDQLKAKHGLDDAKAWTQYALMLLNANEFMYLD
jgi:mono/diheme cytochrome c family protein